MKTLFNTEELDRALSKQPLPLECEQCHQVFYAMARRIKQVLKHSMNKLHYCGRKCFSQSQQRRENSICTQCETSFVLQTREKKRSKSGNNFCSQSCSGTYNNTHRTAGTRRSRLEVWLEQALTTKYPDLEFIFNGKETINSELDIYIPELKLAVELNRIFHYEPIYGPDKLASIQNNDGRKFQACLAKQIELVIIDSSGMKHFKPKNAQPFLDIINMIIDLKTRGRELSPACTIQQDISSNF
jgi:hypothetical protein